MAEQLSWTTEAFDNAFKEILKHGMARADWKSRVVWIPNGIKHNTPESPNVVLSWGDQFDLIPECALKRLAFEAIKETVSAMGEPFRAAFVTAFEKGSGKPSGKPFEKPSGKGSEKPSRKSSPKAIPNQEQEQEQEQEKPATVVPQTSGTRFGLLVSSDLDHEAGARRWKEALDWLRGQVNRHSFETWFSPTRALGVLDGVLYVQIPHQEFFHIRTKYEALLKECLPDLKVEFVLGQEDSHGRCA